MSEEPIDGILIKACRFDCYRHEIEEPICIDLQESNGKFISCPQLLRYDDKAIEKRKKVAKIDDPQGFGREVV
jgi:hypothetical protein